MSSPSSSGAIEPGVGATCAGGHSHGERPPSRARARVRPRGRLSSGSATLSSGSASALGAGLLTAYLSVLVLLPISALLASAAKGGPAAFWRSVSSPEAVAALKLTLVASAIVVVVNALFGTLIAWVLVRDEFPGKRVVNALIDLPFALPTVVAGVVLLALYGKGGPSGIDITFTRTAVALALLFVTLPFVVRSVQPVLMELDRSTEEAASSLGAGAVTVFRRVVLPSLTPAILSGAALSFARAVGEFGSVVLISGNLPFKTEVGSVYIFNQVENDNVSGAAAVSVVLLASALVVLAAMTFLSRRRSANGG
jgi:sulfate/thiosulfate transport system permease protein